MKLPISVFIITKNEEQLISKAIKSVQNFAEEIIIIDSGSTDNTVKIAEALGSKVIFNSWEGYVKQKIFGEKICKNDWILNIDADEELTQDLQLEIEAIFMSGMQNLYKAYKINLVILHESDTKPRKFAPSNAVIRLYNKNYASFSNTINSTTHDSVKLNSNLKETNNIFLLNGIAYHRSTMSIEQLITKMNFYTTNQAIDLMNSGRKISKIRIVFEFFIWFFKAFFIRRYFVFGFDGFIYSFIFSFARFTRLAKVYEYTKNKKF